MATDILAVHEQDGVLVVDSRLIALRLGIQHESFMRTIKKYENRIEQRFGIIRFQIGEIDGRGQPEKYALLTEAQATAIMTFSKNTEEVVTCKLDLVEAFEKAKAMLKAIPQEITVELPRVRDSIEYVEAAKTLESLSDPMMKSILGQKLMEEVSAKLLPGGEAKTCILTVRAKELGYNDKQIGTGSSLGRYAAKRLTSLGKQQHGRYLVHVYPKGEITDRVIHEFMSIPLSLA